ncbi:hypothetical protein RB614_09400 [Phytohabitans sp. ZYX-F-186]|uniref:Uncharacterized protein n=1 Tax=Phytohabitans maris TaxID=3071409 RepID=A0ABU0ZCN2_9ACTN|nr:hypothetical protein [Phytohabitans sp. ZYX-F-186]MDQ7904733.1 hypothetical protein [Phytohabitans sp. ZYX-F-186]
MSTEADESNPERSFVEGLGLRIQREPRPEPDSTQPGTSRAFRLPGSADPSPPSGKLVAMCAWATALGLVGLLVATRALLALWRGNPPTWYEPSFIAIGLVGIGLTVGAFMSIQRRRLPWIMLALATIPLVASIVLTVRAI